MVVSASIEGIHRDADQCSAVMYGRRTRNVQDFFIGGGKAARIPPPFGLGRVAKVNQSGRL
jgi:hypothetical protein